MNVQQRRIQHIRAMNTVIASGVVAAAATMTAALESQRQNSLALRSVATSESKRAVTSCFHSHFRSELMDGVPFDNTLFVDDNDQADDKDDGKLLPHRIHPHMWSYRHYGGRPVECKSVGHDCSYINSTYRCTLINEEFLRRIYGSRYAPSSKQHQDPSIIFNGTRMTRGKLYCLPKDLFYGESPSGGVCDHIAGELEISYDAKQHRFVSKCVCKWPDFFSGQGCDEYIGCRVDSTLFGQEISAANGISTTHARLVNKDTLDEIGDISDLHNIWKRTEGTVDLYATSKQVTHTQGPAWYCACKKVDANLTGGIIGGSCVADPCLPMSNYMHVDPHERMSHSIATGTLDSRDTKLARWNCDCGNPTKTQLYGGGDTPCSPLVNISDYENFEINKSIGPGGDVTTSIRNVKCADKKKIFIPCKNRYRPYFSQEDRSPSLPTCSDMGYPGIANPDGLPEAGACINVCSYCNAAFHLLGKNSLDSDLCSADNRMFGYCETDQTKNNTNPLDARHTYKCSCGKVKEAKLWKVGAPRTSGPCTGWQPLCKKDGESCTPQLHKSEQGPECCGDCLWYILWGYLCYTDIFKPDVYT